MGLRVAGVRQPPLPARGKLLEEGDVPVDGVDQRGERVEQVPVRLLVLLAEAGPAAEVALVGPALEVRGGLLALLDRAEELKRGRDSREGRDSLAGRSVALVFEKPSTRTRVSFEVGVGELGATPIVLRADELQLTRG